MCKFLGIVFKLSSQTHSDFYNLFRVHVHQSKLMLCFFCYFSVSGEVLKAPSTKFLHAR